MYSPMARRAPCRFSSIVFETLMVDYGTVYKVCVSVGRNINRAGRGFGGEENS
jgi:hypothetical protein